MLVINQIYQMEATELLDALDDQSIDALITDPPYSSGGLMTTARKKDPNIKYQQSDLRNLYSSFTGDMRDQRSHEKWLIYWLSKAWRKLKDGAILALFTDWRQFPLTAEAIQVAGFTWLGVVTWDKTEAARPQMDRFKNQAEYCLLARKLTFKPISGEPQYLIWGCKGTLPPKRGVGVLPGVYRHYLKPSEKQHMTAKPLALMRELVKITTPGGLIVDPFAGSGSTLAAAKVEGYSFLGCDLLPENVAIASKRLAEITLCIESLPLFK